MTKYSVFVKLAMKDEGKVFSSLTQMRKKMVKMLMMAGLVVGAYVAGYNEVTHHEVIELVNNIIEMVISMRNDVDTVVERVREIVENTSSAWNKSS